MKHELSLADVVNLANLDKSGLKKEIESFDPMEFIKRLEAMEAMLIRQNEKLRAMQQQQQAVIQKTNAELKGVQQNVAKLELEVSCAQQALKTAEDEKNRALGLLVGGQNNYSPGMFTK